MRQIVERGSDFSTDQANYSVQHESGTITEVNISLTSKAQAKPSPETKIGEWFDLHPEYEGAASARIPDSHFAGF